MAPTRKTGGARDAAPDLAHFRRRYPLTVASLGGLADREAWLRRLWLAETRWRESVNNSSATEVVVRGAPPAKLRVEGEFEIVYAGGGAGLLHAAVLACRYGRRVAVLCGASEQDGGACVWKVSREGLEGLERAGLFTKEEIEAATVNRFGAGRVKFYDAGSRLKAPPLEVKGVLDAALDADRLLAAAATKIKAREGCTIVEGARVVRVHVERERVSVETEDARGERALYAARLFVDARGASSDVARQLEEGRALTHVAPTVGTVARGFARDGAGASDFATADLLLSTEDARAHRQLLWSGFGADEKRGEFTTQLFFYDAVNSPADKSLLSLFERYFEKLPAYKRAGAHFRVVRPVFGYGAGRGAAGWKSRATRAEDRVLLAESGAARANPFSSPGAHLRDLPKSTHLTELALAADLLDASSLSEITFESPRAAHAAQLAEFLRPTESADEEPATVNETLNAVMAALHELDERVRRELFGDRLSFAALRSLVSRTVQLYPRILQRVREHLGARGAFLWLAQAAGTALSERREEHETERAEAEAALGSAEAAREFARYVELYRKGRSD